MTTETITPAEAQPAMETVHIDLLKPVLDEGAGAVRHVVFTLPAGSLRRLREFPGPHLSRRIGDEATKFSYPG